MPVPLHLALTRLQAGRWKTDKASLFFPNFFHRKSFHVTNRWFHKLKSEDPERLSVSALIENAAKPMQ